MIHTYLSTRGYNLPWHPALLLNLFFAPELALVVFLSPRFDLVPLPLSFFIQVVSLREVQPNVLRFDILCI